MSPYRHTAELLFPRAEADYLQDVLGPEVEREVPKCHVTWRRNESTGALRIDAEDLSALRAALNSYIRWTHLALTVRKKASSRNRKDDKQVRS